MEIFDTHCHLDFPEFDNDRDEVIAECQRLGVKHILIPGVTVDKWEDVIQTSGLSENYYAALGLHPYFLQQHVMEDIDRLVEAVKKYRPVAIGEIGLDYHLDSLDKQKQQEIFESQLDVAKSFDLPVVLHVRKAHDEVLKLLRAKHLRGGTVHAFSGSEQQAKQYIELGFKLGFGGSITFERANKLRRMVKEFPLETIVLETDAPDMPPQSKRDGRNSPCYIIEALEVIASLRNQSKEDIAAITTSTAINLFNLQ